MKKLTSIKKSMFEIGQLLVANEKIVKLLYNDNPTALEEETPIVTYDQLLNDNYICVYPPVESMALENPGRNTFIVILLDSLDYTISDNNVQAAVEIFVTTDNHHLKLSNNRNRMFELIDEVIQTLQDVKTSSAGALTIRYVNSLMLSDFRQAYRLRFVFTDQTEKKAEI